VSVVGMEIDEDGMTMCLEYSNRCLHYLGEHSWLRFI